ncbi:MAG: CHAT domain-containing protein [Cyanobacteria bacterium P01_D01_bin.73]
MAIANRRWRAGLVAALGVLLLGDGVTAEVGRWDRQQAERLAERRTGKWEAIANRQAERMMLARETLSQQSVRKVGQLTTQSETLIDGSYFEAYQIEGRAGDVISIQLTSNDFDAFVILLDSEGNAVDSDDDSLGGTHSWLVVELTDSGTYEIQVNAYAKGETGAYELRWQQVDSPMVEVHRSYRDGLNSMREGTATGLRNSIESFEAALAIAQDTQDQYVIGLAAFFLGSNHDDLSNYAAALDYYDIALEKFQGVGEKEWVARTLNGMGLVHQFLGNTRRALEYHEQSLPLYRKLGNRHGEAVVLNNLAGSYETLGTIGDALSRYQQAHRILTELGDSGSAAVVSNNLGKAYAELGELGEAQRYYQQALEGQREAQDRSGEGTTLANIGLAYSELDESEEALGYFQQALAIFQEIGDRTREGIVLNNIGGTYDALGNQTQALEFFRRSLDISRQVGDRDNQAVVLANIAGLLIELEKWDEAIERYEESLALFIRVGNQQYEGLTLSNIAVVHWRKGDVPQALSYVERAIAIVERLRDSITSADLRTSYFASVQDYYQFQIHLLMELHKENPEAGYDRRAFNVSERTRARTLIELLAEANLDVGDTINPDLQRREQELRQRLQEIDAQRVSRLQAVTASSEVAAIVADADRQSNQTLRELDTLASELRQTNPAYADLQYPQPLTVEAVQTQVLDEDTTLLQYSLGEQRSYLWVVNRDGITSYALPGEEEIETAARQFYASVDRAGNPLVVARKAQALSQLILAPAADALTGDRLLIVPDGILHQIPFSAIAVPNDGDPTSYTPLLAEKEIVNAPSATVIATNRRIMGDRSPAPRRLAVIADPIFTVDDPRVTGADSNTSPNANLSSSPTLQATKGDVERTLRDFDLRNIARLPNTQTEAEQLLALANSTLAGNSTTAVLDFDANYDWVTGNNASPYQYVHFATHGFANATHPELSGLILSLVDESGNPRNGFLRLTDIFNLRLPAELVVLSACQTALGENVGGEGMVGLTRGLMYAGAERTVLSLWNVSDEKTADLMVRFYTNIWNGDQTPAAALRQAQLEMWEEGLHPYYWAAFGLQGEWRR